MVDAQTLWANMSVADNRNDGRAIADAAADLTVDVVAADAQVDVTRSIDVAAALGADAAPAGFRGTPTCLARYPTALFCDDFENGLPLNSSEYYALSQNGTLGISSTRFKQGAKSFHGTLTSVAGQPSVASVWRPLRPEIQSGLIYVRGHFYVPSGFSVSN